MFTLRFDMRAPEGSASTRDLYRAAVDMCAWAETRGALAAVLSEHHGTEDGHLAAPHLLASAIAARTSQLMIMLAAIPIPFWDPVRLAEEIIALDIIGGGRVVCALGIGHRPEEYHHFGLDMRRRGALADEYLPVVLMLLRGGSVRYRGHDVRVTPTCVSDGGPTLLIAGGSKPAARRAARHGLGFISQTDSADLREYYLAQCREHGHEPGLLQFPDPGEPTTVFVADDVEAAWSRLGPYLLHDARTAASYRHGDDSVASISRARTVKHLRDVGGPYRILTPDEATRRVRAGKSLPLLPLCGGLEPDLAWPYLECAAQAVADA
ncbi:LLM class flavin-dependent oxidoreductase [Mycobacterium sp. SMC-4]|uniref:LLM class flavin-dependent oxidoreductase n=1 Tax=Mycobacterium sp. SMC-4 TaxID=2857059 RepID=UPI003D086500